MIIGITGHARHGKDSTADIIVEHFDYDKVAISDTMKHVCSYIFGFSNSQMFGDEKDEIDERYGISPRHVLQTLGTEWGQHELSKYDSFSEVTGRKLWVKSLFNMYEGVENLVIADVRFPHEAEAIRERGGFIIRVNRNYPVYLDHESERAIDDIHPDFFVDNYGTLEDLEILVQIMMVDICKKHTI